MYLELSSTVYFRTSFLTSSLALMKVLVALDGARGAGDQRAAFTSRSLSLTTGLGQPAIRKAVEALTALKILVDDREMSPVTDIADGVATFDGEWSAWTAQGRTSMPAVEFAEIRTRAGLMFWLRAPIGIMGPHRVVADEASLLVGDPGRDGPTAVERKLVRPGVVDFNRASRTYAVDAEARAAPGTRYLRWWSIRYALTESVAVSAPELPIEMPTSVAPKNRALEPSVPNRFEPIPDVMSTTPEEQRAIIRGQKARGTFDRDAWEALDRRLQGEISDDGNVIDE